MAHLFMESASLLMISKLIPPIGIRHGRSFLATIQCHRMFSLLPRELFVQNTPPSNEFRCASYTCAIINYRQPALVPNCVPILDHPVRCLSSQTGLVHGQHKVRFRTRRASASSSREQDKVYAGTDNFPVQKTEDQYCSEHEDVLQKSENKHCSEPEALRQMPHLTSKLVTASATPVDGEVLAHQSAESSVTPADQESSDLADLPSPKPVQPSYNLATYVKQSEVLQKLLSFGVDLSAVEKISEAADFIIQAKWESDIQPRLLFLHDIGVADVDLGRVLTKNPLALKKSIEDMQEVISYLKSKKFLPEGISHIVSRAPLVLLMSVVMMDRKLGFLQQSFGLSGDEVRSVAVRSPKLIVWKLQKLKDTCFYMKEMLGFSDMDLKAMLLVAPKVFLTDKYQMGKRFDYLHNVIGISHELIIAWPSVLRTRLHLLQARHRFLLHVGRAQYDPTKENYVSLKALVSGKDSEFCHLVAKVPTVELNNFLKTV